MPTTRRSAASARGRTGPTKGQSTISFSNRVTKDVPKGVKKNVVDSSAVIKSATPETAETESVEVVVDEPVPEPVPEPERAEAEKVTDEQILSYWAAVEGKRRASGVHTEGLDVPEKVLRYFDVSSQYGPCIGMTRMKRWQRAERLGLNPPIEVLATLLREEEKGRREVQTAHLDLIMNPSALAT